MKKKCPICGGEVGEALFGQHICNSDHSHMFSAGYIDGYWAGYDRTQKLIEKTNADWYCKTCGQLNMFTDGVCSTYCCHFHMFSAGYVDGYWEGKNVDS